MADSVLWWESGTYIGEISDALDYRTIGGIGMQGHSAYKNKSGFSALPGGFRTKTGSFGFNGFQGGWWSSSRDIDIRFYPFCIMLLFHHRGLVLCHEKSHNTGLSVRCIKD